MDYQQKSLSTGQSPAVRVFQDGKEISAPTAPAIPHVLTWVYQSIAVANIIKLRKLEESKVPTGTYSFTRPIGAVPFEVLPDPPWISFSVINVGPGGAVCVEVTSSVGALNSSALIPVGGTKNIDFGFPTITKVMFVAPGAPAIITVAAIEGKR